MSRKLSLVVAVILILVWSTAVFADPDTYWVNIQRKGSTTFDVHIELVCLSTAELRVVSIPNIIDASEISGKHELVAGKNTVVLPVKMVADGFGRMIIAVDPGRASGQERFLSFFIFQNISGKDVLSNATSTARLWKAAGGASSVVQVDSKVINCDDSMEQKLRGGDLAATRAFTGILFSGSSADMAADPTTISDTEILTFDLERIGRSGSLSYTGDSPLPSVQEEQTAQDHAQEQTREQSTQPRDTTTETTQTVQLQTTEPEDQVEEIPDNHATDDEVNENRPVYRDEPVERKVETRQARIPGVEPRTNWNGQPGEGRHFGETVVPVPNVRARLQGRVEKVRLVLKIIPQNAGYGQIRLRISTKPTLPPASMGGARQDGYWHSGRQVAQGKALGEFDVRKGETELEFDVTPWIGSNRSPRYFVSALNLSNATVNLEEIRLVVTGK